MNTAKENAREVIVNNRGLPLVLILAATVAVITSFELVGNGSPDTTGRQVALGGSISLFLVGMFLVWYGVTEEGSTRAMIQAAITALLFVGWGLFAGFTTFVAPFTNPGNGYFSAWIGFIASGALMSYKLGHALDGVNKTIKELGSQLVTILVGSTLVTIDGVFDCCSDLAIFAIVVGGFTVSITGLHIMVPGTANRNSIYATFFSWFWLISALVLSFGPFRNPGNGYFGAWACLISSILLLRW